MGTGFLYGGMKMFWKEIMVMVAQYTKNHLISCTLKD